MRSLVIRSVLMATLVLSAAVTATLVDPAVATASQAPNIIGAYAESDICTSCGGSMFTYSWQITSEDLATGSFSGTESSNAGSGTLTGTITGTSVSMTSTDTSGYTWYPKGTIASDCSMSGSWTDSNGNSGTWQATPESGQCSSQSTSSPVVSPLYGPHEHNAPCPTGGYASSQTFGSVSLSAAATGELTAAITVAGASPNTTYNVKIDQTDGVSSSGPDCPAAFQSTVTTDSQGNGNVTIAKCQATGATKFFVVVETNDFSETYASPAVSLPTSSAPACTRTGGGGLYVAMGDSYSAGEGAHYPEGAGCSWGLYQDPSGDPTNTDSLRFCNPPFSVVPVPDDTCHRAITAYPHLVAGALGLTLKFVACSGAVTHDAYAANHSNAIEPAQLSALNPLDRLVTLSFGGNDINFAGVVGGCVTPGKTAVDCIGVDQDELRRLGYDTTFGTAHDGRLTSSIDTGSDAGKEARSLLLRFGQTTLTGVSAALLRDAASFSDRLSVHDRLVFLLRAIRELAPEARILVLGYPRWFGGSSHDVEHFKPLEQRWLNDRIGVADGAIRDAAEQSGVAQYVNVYGAFAGHELSNSTTIWPVDADGHATCHGPGTYLNGVDFLAHALKNSPELMHPNPCGHVAFARAVEHAYGLPHSITRPVAPVLPPGAHIQVTSHHSSFIECRETFHAQVASGALSRVRTFDWYNDGGDLVTDVGSGRHATMTMSAHSAFHFLLVIHGTNGQNRYIAYNSNVLC